MTRLAVFAGWILPAAIAIQAPRPVAWAQALSQPPAWYATDDAARIADNVLLYQRRTGGWPKNIDMATPLAPAARAALERVQALTDSTIDNGATITQIRFLARVHEATKTERFRAAAAAGFDYVLAAQYPSGGWPQIFPLRAGYWSHITYNDGAMVNVMALLSDVAGGRAPFAILAGDGRAARARDALRRGVALTLRLQIRADGRLTGWCQQYDETTLAPASARAYEHVAIASSETVGVARFLMGLPAGDAEPAAVRTAVDGAVDWLRRSELRGWRLERRPVSGPPGYDLILVPDASAPALWARFYDIRTNQPIYSGRDGVIRTALADIEIERRTGYSWVGEYAAGLLSTDHPAWVRRR
jgi:PelA/Pel-15E family pectate lyase